MSTIVAPLFFQKNKAKELNESIFTNTGCFVFVKTEEFPFANFCDNYRHALYSLIIDSYVFFHDYGREFLWAFTNVTNIEVPPILDDLVKYRGLLTHSQFEPDIQVMHSFARLITAKTVTSIGELHMKLSNAKENDYKSSYKVLKDELDAFYDTLYGVTNNSIKNAFCSYRSRNNNCNTFMSSLNQALIKSILQAESGDENPTYSTYCRKGNVEIKFFKTVAINYLPLKLMCENVFFNTSL